jgi:hypothetical protein
MSLPLLTIAEPQFESEENIKKKIRKLASERLGDLFRSRKLNGALESEACLVAGASAMLEVLNEITFNPDEEDYKLTLCPPAWFLCIFSGRGLGELYDDKKETAEHIKELKEDFEFCEEANREANGEEVNQ